MRVCMPDRLKERTKAGGIEDDTGGLRASDFGGGGGVASQGTVRGDVSGEMGGVCEESLAGYIFGLVFEEEIRDCAGRAGGVGVEKPKKLLQGLKPTPRRGFAPGLKPRPPKEQIICSSSRSRKKTLQDL